MWFRISCPKCMRYGWLYQGEVSDMTFFDAEAVKCWSCGHAWWRDPNLDLNDHDLDSLEEIAELNSENPEI